MLATLLHSQRPTSLAGLRVYGGEARFYLSIGWAERNDTQQETAGVRKRRSPQTYIHSIVGIRENATPLRSPQ
jgi:hypothetical protein